MAVISIGGSRLFKNGEFDVEFVRSLAPLLKGQALVVGGGISATKKINEAREKAGSEGKELSEQEADWKGIEATHENARKVVEVIKSENILAEFCSSFTQATTVFSKGVIPVMGGTEPGHTTDAVSAMLASELKTDFINVSAEPGAIFTGNPSKPESKRIEWMTPENLVEMTPDITKAKSDAHFPFDAKAAKVVMENQGESYSMKVFFVGDSFEHLESALKGKVADFGTIVRSPVGGETPTHYQRK